MPLLKYYLWIAPHLLQLGIAVVMLRRQLARLFPWFFAYTCFEVAEFFLLFFLPRIPYRNVSYFSFYAATAVVSTILRFGVILEILRELTSSYVFLAQVLKPFFRWATIGLLIAALALAVYAGGNRSNHSWFVMNMLDRTVLILQTGLLASLSCFPVSDVIMAQSGVWYCFGIGNIRYGRVADSGYLFPSRILACRIARLCQHVGLPL
jgi:hypothetical protein